MPIDYLQRRCSGPRLVSVLLGGMALCAPVRGADPSPEALVKQGNAALERKEFDKALDAYRQAELSKPDAPELAYNQGIAYYRQNDFEGPRAFRQGAVHPRHRAGD